MSAPSVASSNPDFKAFLWICEFTMLSEGGYVVDPRDRGGATKFGISQRAYPQLDIKNLSAEAAIKLYHRDYWKKLPPLPVKLKALVFDASVNLGVKRSIRLLQRVLGVTRDGIWGPESKKALLEMEPLRVMIAFQAERANYYNVLVRAGMHRYARGWYKRTMRVFYYVIQDSEYGK